MSFKLSYLNSNLALTLGYRNPALNNSTLSSNPWPHLLIAKWLPLPVIWEF